MNRLHRTILSAALCALTLLTILKVPVHALDVPTYTTSEDGVAMIVAFEGFDEKRYFDYAHYTIGYGTMYSTVIELFPELEDGVNPDDVVITREQGKAALAKELASDEATVNRFLQRNDVVINQHQFDALISLTYNIGDCWTYAKNDDGTWYRIKQILLDGPSAWTEANVQDAFGRINKAGGVVRESLIRRRAIEANWFLTPVESGETPKSTREPEPAQSGTDSGGVFFDVPADKWYYDCVMEAYEQGLMKGDGFGLFMPEENLTRAQMLQVLANFSGDDLSSYTWGTCRDVPADRWFAPAVAWAVSRDLIQADPSGMLYPDEEIGREEMCVLLARYLSRYGVEPRREALAFRDEGLMTEAGSAAVRYCSARGLVDGVGDGLFDPALKVSRGQMAKILLSMTALFQ